MWRISGHSAATSLTGRVRAAQIDQPRPSGRPQAAAASAACIQTSQCIVQQSQQPACSLQCRCSTSRTCSMEQQEEQVSALPNWWLVAVSVHESGNQTADCCISCSAAVSLACRNPPCSATAGDQQQPSTSSHAVAVVPGGFVCSRLGRTAVHINTQWKGGQPRPSPAAVFVYSEMCPLFTAPPRRTHSSQPQLLADTSCRCAVLVYLWCLVAGALCIPP
jgi:hypothetical protein